MAKAQDLQNNPMGVNEAQAVNSRIRFMAGPSGVNVDPTTFEDKQNFIGLTYKVQEDLDRLKAQNNGKVTPEQVDKTGFGMRPGEIPGTAARPGIPAEFAAEFEASPHLSALGDAVETSKESKLKDRAPETFHKSNQAVWLHSRARCTFPSGMTKQTSC